MYYDYCNEYQPHAVRRIYDRAKGIHHDLRWDGAGNLGQISVANEDALFESGRFLFWTEDSRMHAAVDEKYYSYYTYDHGGERRLKLTGENHLVDVNANYMSTYSALSRPTLYPSAYMVVNSKGYTKHYYAGAERVAARIGGGGLDALISLADGGDSLRTKASHLFTQSIGQVNNRVLEKNEPDCITGSVAEQDELKVWIEGIPEQLQASTLIDYGEFTDVVQSLRADHNGGQEREVYFYHSDHLGSASWITDSGGQAIQHLQYLPYGEPYINQRTSGYNERFTFTGKERDSETGYGYFGARYMDHELMTMWLSVDPMTNKYPSISPYAYCAWNPVKLVDPDGREFITPGYEINEKGELIRVIKDDKYDYFVVRQNNGKRIVGPKYDNGTINKGQSYARRTKKHGSVMVDRYYIKSGLARDGCLQFLADNTNIEWSAFGYSDGTSCLITSHCQYSEYGATDIINAESGIYGEARRLSERQRLENSEGWSLHAFSGLLKITSFDHIHPKGGNKNPSNGDKNLVSKLRSFYPDVVASIFLPNTFPISY